MTRIVSIWLPHWPIERLHGAAARGGQSLPGDDAPFALADTTHRGLSVSAANRAARAEGIYPGLGLADARARCPHLLSAPADPEADARALTALARWCGRYAPAFNVDDADGLWIDIAGAAHLLGGEQALLDDLAYRLGGLGFTARLGLADTPGSAWALARYGDAPLTIVPEEGQSQALAPLPVAGLRIEAGAITLLKRLGLTRIGQLCDLPRASLQRRFPSKESASAVLTRLDQALGLTGEPLKPLSALPCHGARLAFPEPLIAHEGFSGAVRRLAKQLCAGLAGTLTGARGLTLAAYRTNGTTARIRIGLAAPSRRADHMVRLLEDRLDEIDAGDGIDLMTLSAWAVERMPPEQASFAATDRATPVDHLIDRLSGRLTPARVFRTVPRQSHIPERAEAWQPAIHSTQDCSLHHALKPPRPPLLLEKPERIEVLAEVPEGPPLRFTWRRASRRIVRAEGPERIAPEWWHLHMHSRPRDYYRIEDETGSRYWVFRDGLYQRHEQEGAPVWYLHWIEGDRDHDHRYAALCRGAGSG